MSKYATGSELFIGEKPLVFNSDLQRAMSEAGRCLGQKICKLVVAAVDDDYKNLDHGYRTAVDPVVFTVQTIDVSLVGIVEVHGEKLVAFNNDIELTFSPGGLAASTQVINPIPLADDMIENKASKYFLDPRQAMDVANKLNEVVMQRMLNVAARHKKIAETIQQIKQANIAYGSKL